MNIKQKEELQVVVTRFWEEKEGRGSDRHYVFIKNRHNQKRVRRNARAVEKIDKNNEGPFVRKILGLKIIRLWKSSTGRWKFSQKRTEPLNKRKNSNFNVLVFLYGFFTQREFAENGVFISCVLLSERAGEYFFRPGIQEIGFRNIISLLNIYIYEYIKHTHT